MQIRNYLGIIPLWQIRKFLIINRQIGNPQISTKYCTALSQNSLNKHFTNLNYFRALYTIYIREKIWYLRICGLAEVLNPQIWIKIGPAYCKSAKCHICVRFANLTNYLSPKICGYAICGIYLRTTHLCMYITFTERSAPS